MTRRLRIVEAAVLAGLTVGAVLSCSLINGIGGIQWPLFSSIFYYAQGFAAWPGFLWVYLVGSLVLLILKRWINRRGFVRVSYARGWLDLGVYGLIGVAGLIIWMDQVQRLGLPPFAYNTQLLIAHLSEAGTPRWEMTLFLWMQALLVLSLVLWLFWLCEWVADRMKHRKEKANG